MAEDKKKVKFIRKGGKVIPIKSKGGSSGGKARRKDSGMDLRKKGSRKNMKKGDVSSIYKKHGRKRTAGERAKGAAVGGVVGGAVGFHAGVLAGIATDLITKKANIGKIAGITALGLGALGIASGASGSGKVMSNRKYNKELGLKLAKRRKKQNTGF